MLERDSVSGDRLAKGFLGQFVTVLAYSDEPWLEVKRMRVFCCNSD